MNELPAPRFYFALPRLLAKLRGGDPARAERNGFEAATANLAVYAVTYLYFMRLCPETANVWWRGLFFAGLAFVVCLFWLLVLYLNSLILKLLQNSFSRVPARRAQSVLVATTTTAMALALIQRGSLAGEVGALWLTAVAMNLLAAAILAFSNGEPHRR